MNDLTRAYRALDIAWGIIANAGGGDWTRETPEWQEAAARWRDEFWNEICHDVAERAALIQNGQSGGNEV